MQTSTSTWGFIRKLTDGTDGFIVDISTLFNEPKPTIITGKKPCMEGLSHTNIYRLDFEHTWLVFSTPLKNISQLG